MKKIVLLGAVVLGAAVAGHAQESRQDVSISAITPIAPDVYGLVVAPMHTTLSTGVLGSYRYLLTPRSGLELNYSFLQDSLKYNIATLGLSNVRVHTRQQELSAAFVYSRNYHNFNPFLEAGPGAMVFTPILDAGTTGPSLGVKQSIQPGGLFGGGVAYEISPSFDIRAEYRGFVMKTPNFGVSNYSTNRYYVQSTPSIGIAYHF